MAKQYPEISERFAQFIAAQKIFFVGTATADSRVNLSPKGMDSLRLLSSTRVAWLSVTGSGNESAAHLLQNPRMTLMFCAFEGKPLILRLYGNARAVHRHDAEWTSLAAGFPPLPGARQIFILDVDLVQASCGMSVPFFDYVGEREQLNDWAAGIGDEGIRRYWAEKNQTSIDGLPTRIFEPRLEAEEG
ncbi:pyridoxamine 5'-phosphate oxidase family protein [Pseudomonas mangrovi]|uniref:Pyridoxamine 5'-phosphate oxidase n=1 Tax=Pseudomonas mangrovi TaxID=2161748 RepID=A0A2T5PCB3_9PSED|nr:pyridoxamine 5'-phosphate oxidase family protein [Pseudomonas mangrovi]PTU75359.1 pyridoxamine 5'-phosphate oxidase [Pseudomonas mangrovi]